MEQDLQFQFYIDKRSIINLDASFIDIIYFFFGRRAFNSSIVMLTKRPIGCLPR